MKQYIPTTFVTEGPALSNDLEALAGKLGLQTPHGKNALKVALNNICLLDKKQLDYGPRNISSFGTLGCLVRMNDKMERLKTLSKQARKKPQNESIMDSYLDLSNYAIIATLILTDQWPD